VKHLRRNVSIALLVLVVSLFVAMLGAPGVSVADDSGGQVPPPTHPRPAVPGLGVLECVISTMIMLS